MGRRGLLLVAVTGLLLVLWARPASAEWFFDLYGGGAFTAYADLDSKFGSTLQFLEDVEYDASFVGGARFGYWFDRPLVGSLNIGIGVDGSYFEANIDSQTVDGSQVVGPLALAGEFIVFPIDISVVSAGLDLMLRWTLLPSERFPRGQLHPFFTVGPAVFFTEVEDTGNFAPGGQRDHETTMGFKIGAGVSYFFTRNFGLFGEWRFTYFSPEWRFTDNGVSGKVETDITTFHFLVGAAFRF
jgi:opacity protein-like surface antigen